MSSNVLPAVRRRQITQADLPALVSLMGEGFPVRAADYWRRGFEAMATRDAPEGYPRFGYLLEAEGQPVGVILLIYSRRDGDPTGPVQCNLSSWYVREAFRTYATLLTAAALSFKDVTVINSSPAGYTWSILESQGYVRYGKGQFVAVPAASWRGFGTQVRRLRLGDAVPDIPEADLLAAHAQAGCVSLTCTLHGESLPFVFIRWRPASRLKMMRLLWCRETADFVRCAGPIGRFFLRRGVSAVACDAAGPIGGLPGLYFEGAEPKYFRGPVAPRLNDLAFTEQVMFGV